MELCLDNYQVNNIVVLRLVSGTNMKTKQYIKFRKDMIQVIKELMGEQCA